MTSSFTGHIAGIGTAEGTRIVIGMWDESPFGRFADAMVEDATGHRTLIAPRQDVADFVATTYSFDEVRIEPVDVTRGDTWSVHSRSLQVWFTPGGRLWVAPLLRLVPAPLRRSELWARICSPIARRLMPGVQTHGSAGHGRTEWYAARDVHRVTAAGATWYDRELGALAPVAPPVRFGFASSPAQPTLTSLTSYVR
ncbi:hypothetical protein HMPREF0063_11817 [Aeromicrobium marinum DSM 15272]|uniref:Uncharacterized protein n=1 Tax=Aeromicrobium marinum DSM 15272 TaxID=585531 RepID=E2SDN1_9ACTN|nr:hypothetical protein [Aeromicrobium marinum]EFQ82608.1 hypothetical protein HMPREF0063_11817 [Aeromicrobium marinum DSM 15272]